MEGIKSSFNTITRPILTIFNYLEQLFSNISSDTKFSGSFRFNEAATPMAYRWWNWKAWSVWSERKGRNYLNGRKKSCDTKVYSIDCVYWSQAAPKGKKTNEKKETNKAAKEGKRNYNVIHHVLLTGLFLIKVSIE